MQHPIVREALRLTGIQGGIEIVSIADIPAGTGLGSSSSFTVGLLNALYAYQGILKPAAELAETACRIEIELLGEPIGKQDQYIAAYGGICHIQFNPDDSVFVNPVLCENGKRPARAKHDAAVHGDSRHANAILAEQTANTQRGDKFHSLQKLHERAGETRECLSGDAEPRKLGELLHRGWLLKRELAGGITSNVIDAYYEKAMSAGAYGGKISGAGGGGFLLLVVPPEKRPDVRRALGSLREMDFAFEPEGSKIIYVI